MATDCSTTANSITEVLRAGDVILNLTQQPLNTIPGTWFVSAVAGSLSIVNCPAHVRWDSAWSSSLMSLITDRTSRIVVVSDDSCTDGESVVRELIARHISHLHCTLLDVCDEDDFMDEQDSEAVTVRLRQLGYI